MFRHRGLTLASGLAIGALAFMGTGTWAATPAPSGAPPTTSGTADQTAMVRFLNASPNAPAVDVYVGTTQFDPSTQFSFGAISDYLPVPAGTQTLKVDPVGADAATAKPIITRDVTLDAGQRYTIAATNDLSKIEAIVIKDDPVPAADKAQVRFVHLSADTGGVDVLPSGKDVALFSGATYPNATDYTTEDPGLSSVDVRNTGTTTAALVTSPISLQAGDSTSIFAIGSSTPVAGAEPLRLLVTVDDSINTHMRFLNASPDAPAVDVWVDGAKVDALSGISFGAASSYVKLPTGDHQIVVVDTGTTPGATTPIVSVSETLAGGRYHTFAISGPAATAQASLFRDRSDSPADQAHLRVVQLSADTSPIDAGRKGDDAFVTGLAAGHASAYQTVDTGSYELWIRGTGTSHDLLQIDPLQLAGGSSSSAYLVGSSTGAAGAQPLSVVLITDATEK